MLYSTSLQADEISSKVFSSTLRELASLKELLAEAQRMKDMAYHRAEIAEKNTIAAEGRCVEVLSRLRLVEDSASDYKSKLSDCEDRLRFELRKSDDLAERFYVCKES